MTLSRRRMIFRMVVDPLRSPPPAASMAADSPKPGVGTLAPGGCENLEIGICDDLFIGLPLLANRLSGNTSGKISPLLQHC